MHMLWKPPTAPAALPYEVVGIIRDAHTTPEEKASPAVYLPFWDWPPWQASVVVRTAGDPRAVASGVQRVIRNQDSLIGIPEAATMREILDSAVAPRRFLTWLGMLFALAATCLAALGLYGVVSLAAARRRHEIGVRMALGAREGEVVRMVVSSAVALALAGVAAGLAGALAVTRLLASLLYDVRPADPASFAIVSMVLTGVAVLASFIPARRAARVDPLAAIRYE
jgi:predicted lysophospholipase L1 biosynthesis ABC-type transport system permease subunit